MKKTIVGLLCKGYYNGEKYTVDDFCRKLYPLKYIITTGLLKIQIRENAFWNRRNNANRLALKDDISKIHCFSVKDAAYYHIINRFENGDGYGIERNLT